MHPNESFTSLTLLDRTGTAEGGASYATLIPAHFHHTLFEILKVGE